MIYLLFVFALSFLVAPVAVADDTEQDTQEEESDTGVPLDIYWADGLYVDGLWDFFHVKMGGDVQNDTAGFANADSASEALGTSVEGDVIWRRARVYARGQVWRHLEFMFRYDFAVNNPPNLKDAYISIVNTPLPTVEFSAGRFRAPLGLDGFTGADDTVFLEKSTMTSAFLPSRNTGFLLHGDAPNLRIRWSVGLLQPESNELNLKDTDNLGFSGRFAAAFHPFKRKSTLLHLGADFWRRNVSPSIELSSRPESRIAPVFVDTGAIVADHLDIGVIEAAVQRGPLLIQGEVAGTNVTRDEGSQSLFFYAFYVQASYFLTGETAPYRLERGTFRRPRPSREFRGPEGGKGAFEIGARFSRIDLDDKMVTGGRLNDFSFAANWHPTFHMKVLSNVIRAKLAGADATWIFQMRLQVAF